MDKWMNELFGCCSWRQPTDELDVHRSSVIIGTRAGVGIAFDTGPNGKGPQGNGLCVKHLMPGGPGDRSGQIREGFILVSVDYADVRRMSAAEISGRILGEPGTQVRLGFQDPSGERGDTFHEVVLERQRSAAHSA